MIINEEAEVDIPAETINKANHVGPKKKKINLSQLDFPRLDIGHRFYRTRKKLRNVIKLHIVLTKKRFKEMLNMCMPISVAI